MAFPLNREQARAAEALSGPVLIRAGAGSGKTRTLSERFVKAMTDVAGECWEAAAVDEILTITFTDKAAGELSERIRGALRSDARVADARRVDAGWISTIHGFCGRLLRRYALEAGLDPAFAILGTVDQARLFEAAFEGAARRMIAAESGSRLFGQLSFEQVFHAVDSAVGELRKRGLGPDALRAGQAPPVRDVHAKALHLFEEAAPRAAACGDSPTALELTRRCATARCALEAIDPEAGMEADIAYATWLALAQWSPGRSSKAVAEVLDDVSLRHAALLRDAAACAAAPIERELIALTAATAEDYDALKRERNALDFDDLQAKTLELLVRDGHVARECRAAFRLVMVDEFQDTDTLQLSVIQAVAGEDLCTVGDEQQAIYGFRGADVEVYRRHNEEMKGRGAREFKLVENYRSHPAVLGFVNELFSSPVLIGSRLARLIPGRIEPEPPLLPQGEPRVDVLMVNRPGRGAASARQMEAELIARRLAELRDESGVDAGEMTLLLRRYTHAGVYEDALRRYGFDVEVVGGSRFFEMPEVRLLRSLLGAIANPQDDTAMVHVLASSLAGVSDDGLWLIAGARTRAGGTASIWESLARPPQGLSEHDECAAVEAKNMIIRARGRVGDRPLSEVILRALEESEYDLELLAEGERGRQALANVLKFARMADEYEASGNRGPSAFGAHFDAKERYRDRTPSAPTGDEAAHAVRVMSIHAAKGLEFPVVVVAGAGDDPISSRDRVLFYNEAASATVTVAATAKRPDSLKADGRERSALFETLRAKMRAEEEDEAKRLFYVACTRAREVLIVSGGAPLDKAPDPDGSVWLGWLRAALPELDAGPEARETVHEVAKHLVRCQVVWPDEGEDVPELPAEPEGAATTTSRVPVAVLEPEAQIEARPASLSFTDIALYERCKFRFYAEKILRIGALSIAESRDPRRFGSAVHAALQLNSPTGAPDPERLNAFARLFELDEEQRRQLEAAVMAYARSDVARQLESCATLRKEWSFTTILEGEGAVFELTGAIDAYGREGSHGVIADYKTGASGDETEIRDRYRKQAEGYALAALRDGCETVRVVFVRPQVLDGEGRPQEVEFTFSEADSERISKEALRTYRQMVDEEYVPLTYWDEGLCGECPAADSVCPLQRPAWAR